MGSHAGQHCVWLIVVVHLMFESALGAFHLEGECANYR